MNTLLLIFFVLLLAVIIISIALQKIFRCPFLVAAIIFAIFLVVTFALGNLGKPIIFTGSQVSYGIPGTDAVMNLENILRVIVEKDELAGVFLIFGSKIITGTRVKKKTEFDYGM